MHRSAPFPGPIHSKLPTDLVLSQVPLLLSTVPSRPPAQRRVVEEAGTLEMAPCSTASSGKNGTIRPCFITTPKHPRSDHAQENVHLNSGTEFWTWSMCTGTLEAGGSQRPGGCRSPPGNCWLAPLSPSKAPWGVLDAPALGLAAEPHHCPPVALLLEAPSPAARLPRREALSQAPCRELPAPPLIPMCVSRCPLSLLSLCLPARGPPDSSVLQGKIFSLASCLTTKYVDIAESTK